VVAAFCAEETSNMRRVTRSTDLENLKVSNDHRFKALIAESRRTNPPGTGLTTAQVRRALAGRRSRRSGR
jgi:hypothetical protein